GTKLRHDGILEALVEYLKTPDTQVLAEVDSHRDSGGTRPDAVLYSPTHEGPDRTLIDVACADTSKELSKKKVKKVGDFLKRAEERKFSKYENRKKIQITANFAAAA
ncbi:hypothetical protein ADUPG1_005714, partial [Aduncisulcus paluster]